MDLVIFIGLQGEREGFNPKSGQSVKATRRRTNIDEELPLGEAHAALLRQLLVDGCARAAGVLRRLMTPTGI